MAKADKIKKLMEKAEQALQRKNYDLAIVTYMQVISVEPTNIEAHTALRASQTRKGSTSGFKGKIAYGKAKIARARGKHEDAMRQALEGLTINCQDTSLMLLVASSAEALEYWELAAWQRQDIVDKHDSDNCDNLLALAEDYANLDNAAAAIAILEKVKQTDPKRDVDALIRNYSARLTSDIYAQAATQGSRAIVADAEETERLELDQAKLRTDEQRMKAINYRLEHDLVERPNDHRIWMTIGDIAADLENFNDGYKRAKEYYGKALEINASDSSLRDKVGNVEMKKFRLQIQTLQKKVKADADNQDLKKQYQALRKKDLEYRLEEYERRVKAQPMKADFRYQLGQIYMQYKRFDEAIGQLQQAAKDPKYKIPSLTMLGRCFLAQEQVDMAVQQFARAREGQELFGKYVEPLYYEAVALEMKDDKESLEKALAHFTHIYEQDISYKDVKVKVPAIQKRLKELGA